ncbi:MAG: hypothetical protein HGA39_09835 [Coriobacteriia bacterium]|nr:hypothetical protein [Coriobacteriia bacterium]
MSAERPADVVYDNTWELQQEDISDLVEWLAKQDVPEDEYLLPSVRVFVHATFKLKDPRTGFTLPFQGLEYYGGMGHGPSHIEAAIARKSHCGLNLNLPYVEATAEAREYVKELEAFLPFKLSRKHWTLWKLTKAGTGYYRWKGIDMLGASLSHLTNVSS